MQTAEFNHQDFEPSAQSKQDENLLVKFFTKQREDKTASLKEGRPIFKDVEYIDIKVPGQRSGGACRPAQHMDRKRFPRHYAAYQQRKEMPLEGTPLGEWPLMTRTQVEELSFHNVKTVEQLVGMSDGLAANFMGMNGLRQKAKMWLEKTEDTARINEIETLKADNEEKAEKILTLESQMLNLMERFDKMDSKAVVSQAAKPASKKAKV
jgi:hypothetical protein